MKDELFTTPKEKVEAYRAVYRLTTQALEKGINPRKELIQMDTMKEGKVRLGAFESFVQKVDQGYPKASMAWLEKCFANNKGGDFTFVEYTSLQIAMDEAVRALEQLREFFAHIETVMTDKKTNIDDYLKSADQNKVGSIRFEDFEKLLLDNSIKSSAKEVAQMFMILNEFEADTRVGYDQFKRVMAQELNKYKTSRGITTSPSGQKLATASETEAVKTLTNLLQGIKRNLARIQGPKVSFENFLATKAKPENQMVTIKEFEACVREVFPSASYIDLESLVKLNVSPTEPSKVPVGKLDSLLKVSSLQIRASQTNKESEEISKNAVLYKGLEEIGKFAVTKGVAVSEWFISMDSNKSGKLKREVFENCLHSEDVMATKAEKEQFFLRYKPADAKPGEDLIDYKKFELEIGIVYPLYAGMIGEADIKVRETGIILEDILRYIFKNYATVTDWAKDNSRGKGYMNRGDLKLAFGKLQPALTMNDTEFEKIYKTLNPTSSEKIMFYKLEECIMSMVRPLIVEISGRLLNGFDRTKEPLGFKILNSKTVHRGSLPIPALAKIAKEYDDTMPDNHMWLIVTYLDLPLNNVENVKLEEFTKKYAHFLNTNTFLRRPEEIELFISTTSPEGVAYLAPTKLTGTKSPPAEMVPSKVLEHVKPFVLTMKQHYKLLNTEDISALFARLDADGSGSLSKEEFEAAMKHKFPNTPAKIIADIFKLCDKENTGNVKCASLVELFLKTFPEYENKHDLLYVRTEPYEPFFTAIAKSLEMQKLVFRELFEITHVKLQVVLDTIQTRLKVPNTNEHLRKLLGIFVQDSTKGTLDVDEFQAVVKEYATPASPSKKEQTGAAEASPTKPGELKAKAKVLSQEEVQLQALVELIRKYVRKHPSFCVYTFFQYLDNQGGKDGRGKDGKLSQMELGAFLKHLKKDVTPKEIALLFSKIDASGDGFINKDELAEYFGLNVYLKDEAIIEDINTGSKWESVISQIKKGLKDRNYTADVWFDYDGNSMKMKKQDFEKALELVGVKRESTPELNSFLVFMESKSLSGLVDLTKLKLLLEQFSQKTNYANQDAIEIFLWEVLIKFNNDPISATSAFNPDRSEGISFAEFFINSKYYIKKTMTEEEAKSIFNGLKDSGEGEIRQMSFRYKLIEVMTKYKLNSQPVPQVPGQPAAPAAPGPVAGPAPAADDPLKFRPQMVEVGMFDVRLEAGTQSASAAKMALLVDDKLTPEQKKRLEKDALFMRIRQGIGHDDNKLLEKLKAQDVKQSNTLNKFYITETFRKLGVPLNEKETELLFEKVVRDKDDPEQVVYLDLVSQIFPNLQAMNISTAGELVAELIRKLHVTKSTFDSLWLDFRNGVKSVTEITLDDFRYYLHNHGLLLADETIKDIFAEFDESRNFKVDATEFKNKFYGVGNVPTSKKLIASLKNFLTTIGKPSEDAFKPYLDKKDTMDFKAFVKGIEELKFPIKYLEMMYFCVQL